ncbi:serine-rich adhesin for platelets-like isoform X4 [Cherax quadricarinatus]|uniref:serine-rich adhesin for platelets-like isoform X4 n=1 Tax=Cherax quadricarinatus TaxID=27406 RepID=UPI00387E5491
MPVLRARSPRVEGGRCYPRVCWAAVTRATHWGVTANTTTLPHDAPRHQCARAITCNSWPGYTLARKANQGPLTRHFNTGVYNQPLQHQQRGRCLRYSSPSNKHRDNLNQNSHTQATQISAESASEGERVYVRWGEEEQQVLGQNIMSCTHLDSGSDVRSSSDTQSSSEALSANETLSACGGSYSDDDDLCSQHCGDQCCSLVSSASVMSASQSTKSALIVPKVETRQRMRGTLCTESLLEGKRVWCTPCWESVINKQCARGTPCCEKYVRTPLVEMNGTNKRRIPTKKHRSSIVGIEHDFNSEPEQYAFYNESKHNPVAHKSVCKQSKRSEQRCAGMCNGRGGNVLRESTFTVARGETLLIPAAGHTWDTHDTASCPQRSPNFIQHDDSLRSNTPTSRCQHADTRTLPRLVPPATTAAQGTTPAPAAAASKSTTLAAAVASKSTTLAAAVASKSTTLAAAVESTTSAPAAALKGNTAAVTRDTTPAAATGGTPAAAATGGTTAAAATGGTTAAAAATRGTTPAARGTIPASRDTAPAAQGTTLAAARGTTPAAQGTHSARGVGTITAQGTVPHLPTTAPSAYRKKHSLTPTHPLSRGKTYVRQEDGVGLAEGKNVGGGRGCSEPSQWTHLYVNEGQRGSGSSKRGAPFARGNNNNSESHDNKLHIDQKDENQSQPQLQQRRGRAMKISVREEATKKIASLTTPTTRTRSGSRSSGGASPATLHGRTPYKSATVAPAPTKLLNKTNSLNRFGFRSSAEVKSGDSTDSVNSILSDAQTISDSNSNIFDLCDDDTENNKCTKKNSDKVSCDNSHIETPRRLESPFAKLNKSPNLNNTPKLGSGLQSGRITAFTRQLPKPQVVTVKPVNPKTQAPSLHSPKLNISSPHSPMPNTGKSLSPSVRDRVKSPSVRPVSQNSTKIQVDQTSRGKQQSPGNSQHIPRVSRDSESSTKSVTEATEADSGLGSSSESDKIHGDGETDTLRSCNVESTEDVSDAWLREKLKSQDSVKRRSGAMEVCFNGTGEFEVKRHSLEMKGSSVTDAGSPASVKPELVAEKKSKTSKEKREGTITYGMARQKFAPYSRNRFGYGYQSSSGRSGDYTTSTSNSANSPTTNVTKIPGSSGLVRSRVALIETTPSKKPQQTPVLRRTSLKKPIIRPTSLEKTPLLVMPVTEKTIELSKPVCRRLEYSECKVLKSDALRSSNSELNQGLNSKLSSSKTVAGDILIVGSVETEMQKETNIVIETENHGSYYENSYCKIANIGKDDDVPFENDTSSDITSSFSKGSQDMQETEKLMVEDTNADISQSTDAADTSNDVTDCSFSDKIEDVLEGVDFCNKHIPHTPDDVGMKAITPQSESSFEILESLSETIDLTPEFIKDDPEYSATEAESSHESKTINFETKKESDVDSAASLSGSSISLSTEGTSKPSVLQKSQQVVTTSESQTIPTELNSLSELPSKAQNSSSESVQNSPVGSPIGSPIEKKQPFYQTLSVMKSSFESKSSLESSADLQKSMSTVNVMVESGDRSTLSGMCTPTLNAGRGDLDQDFLIDDEIADQPGLMFGESAMASSFFTDDGIFDDLASPSPSHAALKSALAEMGRSRADSVDTTSSLGADDLMLDFDADEIKAGGSSLSISLPGTLTGARPKKMHLHITIPGRRYDEEVLSPDANEIFSEWTAMMAEMGSTISDRCVSRDGSSCGGRTSRTRVSSSSEIASPDPRRPTVLRPPRQGGVLEVEGGGVCIDRTSYHYMCQDVTALKTMLLRLRRVLQAAETINPFDANLRNSLYLSLASSDLPGGTGINGDKDSLTPSVTEISQENVDLRRQVVLLQQQLEERDRTIRLLQQQLAQSIGNQHPTCTSHDTKDSQDTVNAATQTDRSARPTLTGSSLSRAASIDDGLGPTVSFRLGKVKCPSYVDVVLGSLTLCSVLLLVAVPATYPNLHLLHFVLTI